jgi:plastocyanin
MSRDELVERYVEGQMSRRAFVRRLMATGVSAFAALAYADVLRSLPARAGVGEGDFYIHVFDYGYSPSPVDVGRGDEVMWGFQSASGTFHSVSSTAPQGYFNSGPTRPQGAFFHTFIAAGVYDYRCNGNSDHNFAKMFGKVRVPMRVSPASGPLGSTFTIVWASQSPPGSFRFDVQRKRPGEGSFSDWQTGVSARKIEVKPAQTGTFAYRARLRNISNGNASGYSRQKSIQVT